MPLEQRAEALHSPAVEVPTTFTFEPRAYAETFRAKGYVHIVGGVAPEFIDFALQQLRELEADRTRLLSAWEIKNKKQQYLFEFPSEPDLLPGVLDAVADVTGLDREKMTISERHLKVYAPNAAPNPPPHKDRYASEVSVGIPLQVRPGSAVILYPDQSRALNRFDSSEDWRNSFPPSKLPENLLEGIEPVALEAGAGDVVIFLGSTIYHERLNAAGAIVLYLKFNALRLDPLGEDPGSARQRQRSLALLGPKSDAELLASTIALSPRLVRISRHYTRYDWRQVVQAEVAGEKSFPVSAFDCKLIRSLREACTVARALERLDLPQAKRAEHLAQVRRLAERGALDLLD